MNYKYPLEDLLKIKGKRFDQAVKLFEEKTEAVLREKEKLAKLEGERDKVLAHKKDKITQLRQALDAGEKTSKIQQIKVYIGVVEEKLAAQQKKVDAQKVVLIKAEKELEEAKKKLFEKKKELEKIKIHKDEWKIEVKELENQIESVEQDEIGAIRDALKKHEHRKKKK